MKYATIGTSWITESFISAASKCDGITLTAVYSRSPEKAVEFMKKHNAEHCYSDLKEMAKSDKFDAVYIASPNKFHYEQSKLFLLNNKNVICEKPATTTKAEMEELYDLAERKGLIYCEAIMTIHTDGFKKIKENLTKLGRVRTAHFDFCQLSSKYQSYLDGKNPNIFNPEMNTGCLMDIGVYNLYLAASLFGKPQSIVSDCIKLPNGCDASGFAGFKYSDKTVILNYSKVGQTYSYSEIIGDTGTLRFNSVSQLTDLTFVHKDKEERLIDRDVPKDVIMGGEVRFFVNMCNYKDYASEEYVFSKDCALTVREICDVIRKQNNFLF